MQDNRFAETSVEYHYEEIEELVEYGKSLHDQAIYDILASLVKRVRSALHIRPHYPNGAYRMKHN